MWRRFDVRARRRQLTAGLGMMTGAILVQVAELRNWPRPLRESFDLVVILSGLATLVCVIVGWLSSQGESQRP